jgi:hypothetical protein
LPNSGFTTVAAGAYHSLGLKSSGTVVAWGLNTEGQGAVPEPNTNFVAIAAGNVHSLGLKNDGTIIAWGYNNYGQCAVPAPNEGFTAVASGYEHSLALKNWDPTGAPAQDVPIAGVVLHQNHPNPFNPVTWIRFEVSTRAHTALEVFDARGGLVRRLVDDTRGPGSFVVEWDGMNARGESVSTGVYFYRLRTGDVWLTKKMVVLK